MHFPDGSTSQEGSPQAFLSINEARVLGSLIEKELTTPDYYPMTLNALTAACNQKSNREPVMALTENEVQQAFDTARTKALARLVEPGASRVPKYRQRLTETLNLTPPQTAICCELLLRGAQTLGELRSRAERMYGFSSLAEVEAVLMELSSEAHPAVAIIQIPLVMRLPRLTGQKEPRYTHLLCGAPEAQMESSPPPTTTRTADGAQISEERITALEREMTTIREELSVLRKDFLAFKQQLE